MQLSSSKGFVVCINVYCVLCFILGLMVAHGTRRWIFMVFEWDDLNIGLCHTDNKSFALISFSYFKTQSRKSLIG